MILWILIEKKIINDTKIIIKYYPFNNWEKLTIFNNILNNSLTNIYYPFNYIDFYTKKEKVCSPRWWSFTPERLENLSNWELHFREYTKNYFKDIIKDWFIIYDPACSTGTFLSYIKKYFPWCKTIWQDLSEEMTNYAKSYVDEIYTWDAINSPIPNNFVDIIFLRFLNSEIVTTSKAYELFDILEKKVKNGWYIILFWHTAVLLKLEYFLENWNFKILNSSWYNPTNNTIFQYYVIKKK
jgi:hypothetical protein